MHLISWDTLTKPKRLCMCVCRGGDLKVAQKMNWTLLAKLVWRMLNCEGELWCEALKAKYGVSKGDGDHFRTKDRMSQVRKAVVWVTELLRRGLQWEVYNGGRVFFWKDNWLGPKPLQSRMGMVEEELRGVKVAEYWVNGSGWKWELLQQHLMMTDLVKLASTSLSSDPDDCGEVGWMEPRSGKFSVKNAYTLANEWTEIDNWEGWKILWRMKIQHRVKVFAWIMAHEKLLMNRNDGEGRWLTVQFARGVHKKMKESCMQLGTAHTLERYEYVYCPQSCKRNSSRWI